MKKNLLLFFLTAVLLLSSLSLTGCTFVPSVETETITRITLSVGAEIELMVNYENRVITASALDPRALVLISGEELTDITPDKAAERFTKLAAEAGFTTKDSPAPVKLSVSGKSDYVDIITELITKKVKKVLKKNDISASFDIEQPKSVEELSEILAGAGYISAETLSEMNEGDLYYALTWRRKEAASLHLKEFGFLYYFDKEIASTTAIFDKKLNMIGEMGDAQIDTYTSYGNAVNSYKFKAAALLDFLYTSYISADSEYRQLLGDICRAEVIKDDALYAEALGKLEQCNADILSEFEEYEEAMLAARENVHEVENNFPAEVTSAYKQVALKYVNEVSEIMKEYITDYEEKNKADIDAIGTALQNAKSELMK